MAMKLKIDMTRIPSAVKIVLMFVPAVALSVAVIMLAIIPKKKEIEKIKAEITKQENVIATDSAKVAKLSILLAENEKLKKRLDELKLQLPEEREVSTLLKQISDLSTTAGLKIILWKPEQKRDHPSKIIYEIPVSIELSGGYHSLGIFFSSLTKLNRIVNIGDIKLSDPKFQRTDALLKIVFKATTFSGIPEAEAKAKDEDKDKKKGPAAKPAAKPAGKKA